MTKTGNQSVNVSQWAIGSGVKNFSVNVTNLTDTIRFEIHNVTIGQVVELRINNTVINAYQSNATGQINFNYTQTRGNMSYKLQPAVNQAGFNTTWAWFWQYIYVNGSRLTPAWSNRTMPTRVQDTVYQNTNSNPIFVQVIANGDAGHDCNMKVGMSNPPDLMIHKTTVGVQTLSAIVLPSEYYAYYETTAECSPLAGGWTEWIVQ